MCWKLFIVIQYLKSSKTAYHSFNIRSWLLKYNVPHRRSAIQGSVYCWQYLLPQRDSKFNAGGYKVASAFNGCSPQWGTRFQHLSMNNIGTVWFSYH